MKNRVHFSEWKKLFLKAAKDRNIKISNKNLKKLRSAWIDWSIREYSTDAISKLNVLFWCTYGETINNLMEDVMIYGSGIMKIENDGSMYHQPVILGLEHGVTFSEEK